jgi:hypothetical protein
MRTATTDSYVTLDGTIWFDPFSTVATLFVISCARHFVHYQAHDTRLEVPSPFLQQANSASLEKAI